jgi:hypothetical protein
MKSSAPDSGPGDETFPQAAFYSYCYPTPEGSGDQQVQPEKALMISFND